MIFKMKTKYCSFLAAAALLLVSPFLQGCDKDDEPAPGERYFSVENMEDYLMPQKGISSDKFGNGKKFTVRANGSWKLEPVDEQACAWAKIFPMEGEDDGLLRIYGEENNTPLVRTAQFRVLLDGVEQPVVISVSQSGCQPYLNVASSLVNIKRAGGSVPVGIDANVEWEYAVEGDPDGRFSVTVDSPSQLTVSADRPNQTGAEIHAAVTVSGKGEFSGLSRRIEIVQLDATFFDNFSWLKSEAGVLGWKIDTGKKEIRIDQWTAEEKEHGWESLSTWVYARTGFLKFGKGGYGGDLMSPAVPEIGTASDVTVSWSALGYGTTKNVKDDYGQFYVAVLGPGSISGCSSQGETGFSIKYRNEAGIEVNLPAVRFSFADDAWMLPVLDPTATEIWQHLSAQFSINVKGMDGTSRIVFVAGRSSLENSYQDADGKNSRMFLDNFKIVVN